LAGRRDRCMPQVVPHVSQVALVQIVEIAEEIYFDRMTY
jgi:hypothetical protein